MRTVIVTKDQTDYARTVNEFLHDFEHETGHFLELIDPESPAGAAFCEAYDIVEYPTILALADQDGTPQHTWVGLPLPTVSEVSYYA